ncbi:hypothetical protein RIR_jg39322.t2 [Rhizophagus irregularis DAOM 181602=DAOM 197198]|nr:hypothetical protein RIR_jg39322.t2 [Rhizophagus irregularis DAOM 181602=DAOM 197198]
MIRIQKKLKNFGAGASLCKLYIFFFFLYPIGLGMNWYRSLRFLGQLLSFYSVHPTCNTIRGPFGFISASEGIISSFFVGIAVRTLASWTSSVEFLDVGWHLDLDWYRYRLRFLGSSSVFSLSAGSPWPMGFRLLGSPWVYEIGSNERPTSDELSRY